MQNQKKPEVLEDQVGDNKNTPSDTAENRTTLWPTCILHTKNLIVSIPLCTYNNLLNCAVFTQQTNNGCKLLQLVN